MSEFEYCPYCRKKVPIDTNCVPFRSELPPRTIEEGNARQREAMRRKSAVASGPDDPATRQEMEAE